MLLMNNNVTFSCYCWLDYDRPPVKPFNLDYCDFRDFAQFF